MSGPPEPARAIEGRDPVLRPAPTDAAARVGVVVIGRNEGERLVRCLHSVGIDAGRRVVYVDSGSADGSPEVARRLGAAVVELDLARPFTAARARNAGLRALLAADPDLRLAQFVDADCELRPGWIERAAGALTADAGLAMVWGRMRERDPERSLVKRMFDLEWSLPAGEVDGVNGLVMLRVAAVVRGDRLEAFREDLIAGEEPELAVRLREAGWRVRRLDAPVATHDAGDPDLRAWWRRLCRAGYAYAEGAHLHGAGPLRHWVAEQRRAVAWGLALPAVALAAAPPTLGASLLLLAAYPLQALRLYVRTRRRGRSREDALAYGALTVVGKLAEAQGVARFHRLRLAGRRSALMEYKGPAAGRAGRAA
jgi:GT2 family glycosyltransferase